jgi:hypothetical protein
MGEKNVLCRGGGFLLAIIQRRSETQQQVSLYEQYVMCMLRCRKPSTGQFVFYVPVEQSAPVVIGNLVSKWGMLCQS